jgi:hypothetical protein
VIVAVLFVATSIDAESAALFTSIVAAAAAEDARIDVVTSEDLRRAITLEADKSAAGCDDQSCLAEIANAMNARVVLYGTAGSLDDELIVTLQLFDSTTGSSGGRSVARATTKKELSRVLADDTRKLVAQFVTRAPPKEGERIRFLVLDLKGEMRAAAAAAPAEAAEAAPSMSPLFIGGLVAAGAGVVGVGAGVAIDVVGTNGANTALEDKSITQQEAQRFSSDRESAGIAAIVLYAAGGVLVVGGATAAALSVAMGGE